MNSSPNSETTRSTLQYETKQFTKYGVEFTLHVIAETQEEWLPVMRDAQGNVITNIEEHFGAAVKNDVTIQWEKTGNYVTNSCVDSVRVRDTQYCQEPKYIEVLSTPDGPIMGIIVEETNEYVKLLDPCVVIFDGKSRIRYMPIFNVGRIVNIMKAGIRSRMAPAEVLIASYPGFLIQNRMYKYQLKPILPMASSPELDNSGTEVTA